LTRNIATAPDQQVRGTVHSYWLERRRIREASRKQQAPSGKQQAASSKPAKLFPVDMCRK